MDNANVQAGIELEKDKSKAEQILAQAKREDGWKRFQEKIQKFQLHVKGGAEKVVTWYEDNWLNTVFGGVIMGTSLMLFAQLMAISFGATGFLVGLYLTGGWAVVVPFVVALAYWAIKVAIGIVASTVRGIVNAAKNIPTVEKAAKEKIQSFADKLTDHESNVPGAEATA